MLTKEQAAEKIRKLLQRNGRTEEEADTAAILAAALAEKHGIDIAGLDQADNPQLAAITHHVVGQWAFLPDEAAYASLICKRFFEVNPFERQCNWMAEMVFVGTALHIELAEYVFNFLIKEFRWQWNRRRGRCRKRKQFIYGCYQALYTKLFTRFATPEGETSSALEISFKARRAKYIEETFGEMTTSPAGPKDRKSAAIHRGYQAGQDIEIRPAVPAGQTTTRQALPSHSGRLLTNG
jgi:Protein of unknown function (DUF2786)